MNFILMKETSFFIENKNEVLKRSQILETLWGEDDYFLGRSLYATNRSQCVFIFLLTDAV